MVTVGEGALLRRLLWENTPLLAILAQVGLGCNPRHLRIVDSVVFLDYTGRKKH